MRFSTKSKNIAKNTTTDTLQQAGNNIYNGLNYFAVIKVSQETAEKYFNENVTFATSDELKKMIDEVFENKPGGIKVIDVDGSEIPGDVVLQLIENEP